MVSETIYVTYEHDQHLAQALTSVGGVVVVTLPSRETDGKLNLQRRNLP